MKYIMNVLKNEIFNQFSNIEGLVKKVTVSQESYLKDRGNESLYDQWSENVQKLQKSESDMRYLKSAYATICNACEVEPMTVEAIVSERTVKAEKRAARKESKERKPNVKKNEKEDGESK